MRKIRAHGAGAVAEQRGKVMHCARLAAFEYNGGGLFAAACGKLLCRRGNGKKRRYRRVRFIHAAVGKYDNVRAAFTRAFAFGKHIPDSLFKRVGNIVGGGNARGFQPAPIKRLYCRKLFLRKQRALQPQRRAGSLACRCGYAAVAGIDRRIRDNLFAQGIYRRICDLCKELLEVIKKQPVCLIQEGKRYIHAHGGCRLAARCGSGKDILVYFLVIIPERGKQPCAFRVRIFRGFAFCGGERFHRRKVLCDPFAVGLFAGIKRLAFLIRNDPARSRIHQQHPAGHKPRIVFYILRRDIQHAGLGGKYQPAVRRFEIPCGAKPVAVQRGAENVAVRKDHGGGTVPRLHHRCVIAIHIALCTAHGGIVAPRFGYHCHHGERQRYAVHHKEFERVIQHCGIRAGCADNRKRVFECASVQRAAEYILTRSHAQHVAADSVYFAVVEYYPVRVGAFPARIGIGGKTGMYGGNGAFEKLIRKIGIKSAKLTDKEHTLVYNGTRRKRADICLSRTLVFENAAHRIKLAVEPEPLRNALRAADKALLDYRAGRKRLFSEHAFVGGYLSPRYYIQPSRGPDPPEPLLFPLRAALRQEKHTDTVVPRGGKPFYLPCEEPVRYLYHYADTVAGLAGYVRPRAVAETFHNRERIGHSPVRGHAVYINDRADTAGVACGRGIFPVIAVHKKVGSFRYSPLAP